MITFDEKDLLRKFEKYIQDWNTDLGSICAAKNGRNDIYLDAEPDVRDIMNILCGYSLYKPEDASCPGYDLRDDINRIVVQVTHQYTQSKIDDCIATVNSINALTGYTLYIVFLNRESADSLNELQSTTKYKMGKVEKPKTNGRPPTRYAFSFNIKFDPEKHLINLDKFTQMLMNRQSIDRKVITHEAQVLLLKYLSKKGKDYAVDHEERSNLGCKSVVSPAGESFHKTPITLREIRTWVEQSQCEEFADDLAFMESIFPKEIIEILPKTNGQPSAEVLDGRICKQLQTSIVDIFSQNTDIRRNLLKKCKSEWDLEIDFTKIFDRFEDEDQFLRRCAQRCDCFGHIYIGVAMMMLCALLGAKRFRSWLKSDSNAKKYFYPV